MLWWEISINLDPKELTSVLMLTVDKSIRLPQVFEGRECQPAIVGPTLPGNPTPLSFCRKEVALE